MANRLSVTNAELRKMAKRFQEPRRKKKAIRVTRLVRDAWRRRAPLGRFRKCHFCAEYDLFCELCPAGYRLCDHVMNYVYHGGNCLQVTKLCDRMILALQGKL